MAATGTNLEGSRVFVSYPRGGLGHTWAEKVQRHLENLGAEVWRDEASIREGDQDWYRCIDEGLEKSTLLIGIIGQDTSHCEWQQREMLRAVQRRKPIVPLRIAAVGLPLYIQEKQPVEIRQNDGETLAALTDAILAAWEQCNLLRAADVAPNSAAGIDSKPATLQRQREIAYLNELIHSDYSDREDRYVPLEGKERQSSSLARSLKGLRMDTDAVLRAFGQDGLAHEQGREKTYPDVLDAYRDLQQRPVRRLAVLGEPGAGKSFSLERIAVEYARRALKDLQAPIPLLVALGFWTREAETLQAFIERHLGELGRYFGSLRDQKRAVLLLDAMNEIPPGQRKFKASQIRRLAEDERFASVVVSCREKDFAADFSLPFDTLTLQPLVPTQIRAFLHRALSRQYGTEEGPAQAEARFWQIAGGEEVRQVWEVWEKAGATFELFWSAADIPDELRWSYLSWEQQNIWHRVRSDPRGLIRLAANPYLLTVMMQLPVIPRNRAQLFAGFLRVLFDRERTAREQRHDAARVPPWEIWEAALVELAEALQRKSGAKASDGAQTALPRAECPAGMSPDIIDFSMDASVLEVKGDAVRFTHQLLQEYLASRLLLEASRVGGRAASDFWPSVTWWSERTGWEVVAEIAAESYGNDAQALACLLVWISEGNPEVACEVWQRLGQPDLPKAVLASISDLWLARMTDVEREPDPRARAAIGRALGRFGLDRRKGVGLRPDSLPDIDWVKIPAEPFIYQKRKHRALPTFYIARYPVTNAQFDAFIQAGGYREDRWWVGLAKRLEAPDSPTWDQSNAPREAVSWYEAVAFCRWLSARLGFAVTLPTEQQWERAARGTQGLEYPWGKGYKPGYANCYETGDNAGPYYIDRTTTVGIYPQGASPEGVLDMAGNVFEWCLNEYDTPKNVQITGREAWVLRGGSWYGRPAYARSARRGHFELLGFRPGDIGFRVVCSSSIE